MSDPKRVNGSDVSWGSIKLFINGEPYYGFTSIDFGDKRERVFGYGLGAHHGPSRQSRGKYSTEPLKLKGFKAAIQAVRQALADESDSGTEYGDVEFNVTAQFVEGDVGLTVELEQCTWAENASAHEENPDPLQENIAFTCRRIKRNGLVLWSRSDGDP